MPTLIRDVILAERARTEAQSGGVTDQMRRAGVAPLAASGGLESAIECSNVNFPRCPLH